VNTKFAVPPVAVVVPPVTVTVSAAVRPTVVVIVELESEADGGSLIRIVTVRVAVMLFESVAVNVCVTVPAVFLRTVITPEVGLNETPVFAVFITIFVVPVPPVLVMVSVIVIPIFVVTVPDRAEVNTGPALIM
jgi:hypothetical protein